MLDLKQLPVHTAIVGSERLERAAMASFCASLSADEWTLLQQLSERVRNELLKRTIGVMMKWRGRQR